MGVVGVDARRCFFVNLVVVSDDDDEDDEEDEEGGSGWLTHCT